MQKHKKIINWRQVSNQLAGNPESIRSNYSGKKYMGPVNELIKFTREWLEKNKKDGRHESK